jgi:hypothetical protein
MAEVVYFADKSNRHLGLGATIRLDSAETCIVSFASNGVRVRRRRWIWFGDPLFVEHEPLRVGMIAYELMEACPESTIPPGMVTFALIAFTKAILSCRSCAEVTKELNAARERAKL